MTAHDHNENTPDTMPSETEPVYHYGGQEAEQAVSEAIDNAGCCGGCAGDAPGDAQEVADAPAPLRGVSWPFPGKDVPKAEKINGDTLTREDYDAWFTEARQQTMATLPAFLDKMQVYKHSYDSVVYATVACAYAAASAFDRSDAGGISGFQAGFVALTFVQQFLSIDGPLRVVTFKDMLYPHYADKFAPTIPRDAFTWMQEQAKRNMEEYPNMADSVRAHQQSIIDGQAPFGFTIKD